MTPEQRETLAGAIAHHNDMVRLYREACDRRDCGDLPEPGSPLMNDILKLAIAVEPLRGELAAFAVQEIDQENMGPHFVSQELLSTMRTLVSTAHGARLRHVPEMIQPDGIPECFREAWASAS